MKAMIDKVITVPIEQDVVSKTISKLPRHPDEAKIVAVQLKRKLEMRNTHLEEFVRPAKCIKAVEKLKELGNPHYQDVDVNEVDDTGSPVGLQIHLRYRFVFAKVLDAKRNFLQAAHEYYRITTDQTAQSIEEDDILNILKCALTCAVLGTAGPQRKRVLGVLYKDVRTQEWSSGSAGCRAE